MPITLQDIKGTVAYKLVMLMCVFPWSCLAIAIDRYLCNKGVRNLLLGPMPRNVAEIRRDPAGFFKYLQKNVTRSERGVYASADKTSSTLNTSPSRHSAAPLIPKGATMLYVDVKDGSATEPDKNRGVAVVEVAFYVPCHPTANVTGDAPAPMMTSSSPTALLRQHVQEYCCHSTTTVEAEATSAGAETSSAQHDGATTTKDSTRTVTVLRLFV